MLLQNKYECEYLKRTGRLQMPTYDYKCNDCQNVFESVHGMNEKCEKCSECKSLNIKKLFNHITFSVSNGTIRSDTYGYKGKHTDLVRKMKGNKDYQSGFRNELSQQSRQSLADFRSEREMKTASETFQKMKTEGEKMTKAEKEQIKAEFGIKKGMKAGNIGL